MRNQNTGTNALPFKDVLSRIMQERELTLRVVADLAGVQKSVVQSWLSGANPHDLQAVARLGKALGIGFKELLLGEPETTAPAIDSMYERVTFLEGMCEVSIKRLVSKEKR